MKHYLFIRTKLFKLIEPTKPFKHLGMIQRIQTLWLLLASACAFAGLKIAFYTGNIIPEGNATPGATLYQEINGMYSI